MRCPGSRACSPPHSQLLHTLCLRHICRACAVSCCMGPQATHPEGPSRVQRKARAGSHLRAAAGQPGRPRAQRRRPAARPACCTAPPRGAPPRPAAAARSAGAATPGPPPPRRRPAPPRRRRAPPRQLAPAPRAAAGSAAGAARRARRASRAAWGSPRARGPPRRRPARRALAVSAAVSLAALRGPARARLRVGQGPAVCYRVRWRGRALGGSDQLREAGAPTAYRCELAALPPSLAGGLDAMGAGLGVPSVKRARGQRELDQAERVQAGHAPAGAPATAPRRCWRSGRAPGCGPQGRRGPPFRSPRPLCCCVLEKHLLPSGAGAQPDAATGAPPQAAPRKQPRAPTPRLGGACSAVYV